MAKKFLLLLATVAFLATVSYSCKTDDPVEEPEDPQEQEDPQKPDDKPEEPPVNPDDYDPLKATVLVTQDWVYEGRPQFTFQVENPNEVVIPATVLVRLTKDVKGSAGEINQVVQIPPKTTKEFIVTTEEDMAPGFYQAACFVNKKSARRFTFGVDPTKIVSAPDMQDDFKAYWQAAKDQLAAVDMKPNLILLDGKNGSANKSNENCNVYFVEFQSVPDSPDGDPVTVRGYYLEPTDGKPHPVIMHFYGYDTMGNFVSCPSGNSGNYAEFYLSHRGQYINRAPHDKRGDGLEMDFTNEYDVWYKFQFGDLDGYYYRGAFMDCVQAVNFMATRATSDMNNLFAEGASQGGALTYAAAALSDHPFSAIAPCVAFLGDYPDYFKIVSWPGDWAKECAKKLGMSDEEMYRFLSYFDTKNLATLISCPVIASSCLQDGTCPPHTNLAPYNNLLSTDKEIYFYPLLQHEIPSNWPGKTSAFFKAHTK